MDRRTAAPFIGEALGTLLFVFVGCAAVVLGDYMSQNGLGAGPGLVGVALAHGIALAVAVTAFAAISGGHINPAVTVGVWIDGGIDGVKAVGYIVAQLVGASVGALLVRATFPQAAWDPSHLGKPALGPGIDPVVGIVLEVVMTAVLVTAVFHTAVDERAPKLGGLLVGLSIAADILAGGPLTGAAMNPARWFGPALASGDFRDWYVWVAGPVLGAAIVALLYRFVFAPTDVVTGVRAAEPKPAG